MVGTALTDDGRAFHARAAATGKARSPSVELQMLQNETNYAQTFYCLYCYCGGLYKLKLISKYDM